MNLFFTSANGQTHPRIQPDEFNLVYVAITRAKKRIVLNYGLMKFLEYAMVCIRYLKIIEDAEVEVNTEILKHKEWCKF